MPPWDRLDQEPLQKQTQNRPIRGAPHLRSAETWSICPSRRNSVMRFVVFYGATFSSWRKSVRTPPNGNWAHPFTAYS